MSDVLPRPVTSQEIEASREILRALSSFHERFGCEFVLDVLMAHCWCACGQEVDEYLRLVGRTIVTWQRLNALGAREALSGLTPDSPSEHIARGLNAVCGLTPKLEVVR